jgi:hypothetical protein
MGPDGRFRATFRLQPQFQTNSADLSLSEIARIRVILSRGSQVALDTIVPLPATPGDTIALDLRVPISGEQEQFSALLRFIGPQGDTLFAGGPVTVTAVTSGTPPPNDGVVAVTYSGPGATTARAVRFERRDTAGFFGDTITLPATVTDAQGAPISNVLIDYASLDTTRAVEVTPRRFLLRTRRGPVRILARTFTGLADTATLTVQPVPVALRRIAGDAQSATVNTLLPGPLTVRVLGADSLGVRGVQVRFTRSAPGGSVSDTVAFTDSTGTASTRWTLSTVAGTSTVSASAPGRPALTPVAFSGTANPGAPVALALTTPPSASVTAGTAQAVAVQVNDAFGNRTPFADTVRVTLDSLPPGATLGGTVRVVAAAGAASFPGLVLTRAFGGYRLRFDAPAAGNATVRTVPFAVVPAAPQVVAITTNAPATVTAGTPFRVEAEARDTFANVTPAYAGAFTVALGANPGAATLSGTLSRAAVNGAVAFDGLTLNRPGTGTTLVVSGSGLPTGATSAAFVVQPGAPVAVAFTAAPSASVAAGTLLAVTVEVRDAQGNRVTSFADTVTLALDTVPVAGAQLTGPVQVVAVGGVATFSGAAIARASAGYRLRGVARGVSAIAVTPAFTVTPAAAQALVLVRGATPANVLVGAVVDTVEAEVRDAFGNAVTGFADSVRVVVDSTTAANPLLQGTVSRVPVNGRVVFGGLTVRPAGAWRLAATASGLTKAATALFTVTAPTPTTVAAFSATTITAPVFTQLGDTVAVRVTGAGGVPVAGVPVTWEDSANGTIVVLDSVTSSSGVARVRYRLSWFARTTLLVARTSALPGQTVTFSVTGQPLAPRRVRFVTTPPATVTQGVGFGVSVSVRDTFDNAISDFPDTVRLALAVNPSSATLLGTAALAVSAPTAAVTLSLNTPGIGYRLSVSAPGLIPDTTATFQVQAVGGGTPVLRTWTGAVNSEWVNAGNWSPAGMPNQADTVRIPLTSQVPVLMSRDTVEVLDVLPGANLVLMDTLFVNVRAMSRGVTTGSIVMMGASTVVAGTFGSLRFDGTGVHSLTDSLVTAGSVETRGALFFSAIGPQVIGGTLITSGPIGTVSSIGDTLTVLGSAIFSGDLMPLAFGTLVLAGDLLQNSDAASPASFAPSGAFSVVLVGTSNQTIQFQHPATVSRLANLTVQKPSGLVFLTGDASNAFTILGSVTLVSGQVQAAASGLEVSLAGSLLGNGTLWQLGLASGTVRLANPSGSAQSLAAGAAAQTWRVPAGFTWTLAPGSHGVTGEVQVNGVLDVGSSAFDINGPLAVDGNSATVLALAGSVLTVAGNARFEGSVLGPNAGTFRLRGDLTQVSTYNGASYRPSGTHETVLDGATMQTVTFQSPGTLGTQSRFQRLRVAGGGTQKTFASELVADSVALVGSATAFFLTDTVTLRSLAYEAGASSSNWAMADKVTRAIATGNVQLPAVMPGRYFVPISLTATIQTSTTFRGPVHVRGQLSMTNGLTLVADSLLLLGDTTAGYSGAGQLTGGGVSTIFTVGSLRIRTATGQTWTGAMRVLRDIQVDTIAGISPSEQGGTLGAASTLQLVGTGPQTIRVAVPAQINGRFNGTTFNRTEVFNTAAPITIASSVAFQRLILNIGSAIAPTVGADTVVISDSLTLRGSDATQYPMTGRVTKLVSGARALPDTVAGNVLVNGNFSVNGTTRILGNVVSNALLTINGRQLTVDSALTFNAGAALQMTFASDRLTVGGNLTFGTGSVTGLLTNGIVTLLGNLSVQAPNAFQPGTPHRTVFAGTNAQVASMTTPWNGTTGSRFGVAQFDNPLGVQLGANLSPAGTKAVFLDSVFVNGPVTTASAGDTVEIRASGLRMANTSASYPNWGMTGRVTRIVSTAIPTASTSQIVLPDSLNGTLEVLGTSTTFGIRPRRGPLLADSVAYTVVRENLSLRGALELQRDSMTVLGNLITSGTNEGLRQISTLSSLVVQGNATFGSGPSASTAGLLDVRGNFVTSGAGTSFNPNGGGTHVVRMSGSLPQRIVFANPGFATGQYFQRLDVANSAGVTFGTSAVVNNQLTVTSGTVAYDSAHAFTEVRGGVVVTGGSLGTWSAPRVLRYAGSGPLSGPATYNGTVEYAGSGDQGFPSSRVINGNLLLTTTTDGGNLRMTANSKLTVNGDLTFSNFGAIRFLDGSSDTLEVTGNTLIAGVAPLALANLSPSTASDSGVLILRGNLTQSASSLSGISMAVASRTRFLGSSQQIALQRPTSFVSRRFGRMEIGDGSATTTLTITDSSFWATSALRVRANGSILGGSPGRRIVTADSIIVEAGGVIDLGTTGGGTLAHVVPSVGVLSTPADTALIINGSLTTDTLEMGGGVAHRLQTTGTGTVSRTHLKVATGNPSTFHRLPPGTVSIPGTLWLGTGSALETGGAGDTTRLTVNRIVNTGGVFRMNDGADSVHVVDSLVASGAAAVDYFQWNQGRVALLGPVSLQALRSLTSSSPLSHRTWFAGAGRQTIAFPAAGLTSGLTPGIFNFEATANRSSADSLVGILRASRINITGTGSGLTPFVFDDASRRMEVQGTLFAPSSVQLNFSSVAGLNEPGFTYVALGAPPGDTATVRDISASFSPDTLILRSTLAGVMARFEGRAPVGLTPNSGAPYPLRSVVSEGSAVSFVSFAAGLVSIANDLIVPSDRLVVDTGDSLSVGGTLRTTGSGYVDQSGDSRIEALDVDFRGTAPSATPTLAGGSLTVRRNFTQAASPLAFRADANHTTFFADSGSHTVSFANPDTLSGSRFGQVNFQYRDTTARVMLGSDIAATGQVLFDASTQVITSRPARVEAAIPRTVFGYEGIAMVGTPSFEVTRVALSAFNASSDNTFMSPGFGLAVRFLGDYGGLTPYALEGDGGLFFGELDFTGLVNPPSTLMRCRTAASGTGLLIAGLFTGTPPIAIASPSLDSRFLRQGTPACIVNVTPSS